MADSTKKSAKGDIGRGAHGVSEFAAAVGPRIGELAKTIGPKRLAEAMGVHETQLYRYIRGENVPGLDVVAGAAKAGANVNWVLTGEGTMLVGLGEPRPGYEHGRSRVRDGYAYIPLLDVRARGGGAGEIIESEGAVDSLAFKEDWIRRELRVLPGDLRLIFVEGDSMEPDLRSGDIILIDHTDTAARREGIYVLRMDGALLVKTLQRLPGGVIKVLSKNELYEPFSVKSSELDVAGDFAIIGRVVWACRRY